MSTRNLAAALATGSRFHKWATVGDSITGTLTNVEVRQARQFGTDLPAVWQDGSPQMQVVLTVSTGVLTDANDDGTRSVVVNLWGKQRAALGAAVEAAGVKEPAPGMTFTATWVSGAGGAQDPRTFHYELGNGVAAALAPATPAAPAAPVASTDAVELAKTLRSNGVDTAAIAAATGLPAAVIEALPGF